MRLRVISIVICLAGNCVASTMPDIELLQNIPVSVQDQKQCSDLVKDAFPYFLEQNLRLLRKRHLVNVTEKNLCFTALKTFILETEREWEVHFSDLGGYEYYDPGRQLIIMNTCCIYLDKNTKVMSRKPEKISWHTATRKQISSTVWQKLVISVLDAMPEFSELEKSSVTISVHEMKLNPSVLRITVDYHSLSDDSIHFFPVIANLNKVFYIEENSFTVLKKVYIEHCVPKEDIKQDLIAKEIEKWSLEKQLLESIN